MKDNTNRSNGIGGLLDVLINRRRVLHFTLIDPDRQPPGRTADIARGCSAFGTDAFMVGGTSPFGRRLLEATIRAVKENTDRPVIIFPNSADAVSAKADAIYCLSLLNALDPRFFIGEQVRAARALSRTRLVPISLAYIVVGTSRNPTSIERRVPLDPIGIGDIGKARDYALAAEYLGMGCIYLEAGSGADRPVPSAMIRAVRRAVSVPMIVGGGIRDPRRAQKTVQAGADVVVTGTIVERDIESLEAVIRAVKTARP